MNLSNRALLTCVLAAVVACATSYTPRTNTRADLVSYVERAATLVAREGPSCATLAQPAWMKGDYYIFVSDLTSNVVVCQPVRPDMVGRNQDDLRDPNGVYIVREMNARANSAEGRGWVEYLWPRPGETNPIPKTAYVVAVTGPDGKRYVVGSGAYNMEQ